MMRNNFILQMKKYKSFTTCLFFFCSIISIYAQNPPPATGKQLRVLLLGGTIHTGRGNVIENGALGFANGKINLIADATLIKINATDFDTILNIQGKHVYPSLIAMNSTLGLNEIAAVRATRDFDETGSINPSVRTAIAYNTDSKVTPTVRSNGILLAQIVPKGGLISGQSSVMKLDGWNYEDALYLSDQGIHMNWPSMRAGRSADKEAEEKQRKQNDAALQKIEQLFSDAKAYSEMTYQHEMNLHLEAMEGLFNGSKSLYVNCSQAKEIIAAADMCGRYGIKMVLVGGSDSWMVTDLLKERQIPVVLVETHRLPSRQDEPVDMPYRLPSILKNAGIPFAIAVDEFWQTRNLAFQAGTTIGYGLTAEEALQAVSAVPAKILGIDSLTGTLSENLDANIIVSKGELFDITTHEIEIAYIQGRIIDLDNIHKQLYRKYRKKYGIDG
jgi:imidazolonepropionase-like amidohydrolase